MAIGKPNQNIAVLRGLALPTRNILASTKLRDCSEGTSKATCAFVLATLHPVGRASPLKTAIFDKVFLFSYFLFEMVI